jgi:non-ribosomal peptide synthetase component F
MPGTCQSECMASSSPGPACRGPLSVPRPTSLCSLCASHSQLATWGNFPDFDLSGVQAAKTPNAPAITYENKTLSYGELDELTDRMAFWLQQQGCGLESIGVIYMNKQTEYMVAYIAILKAGAAYLPMDVAYPPDLVDMVLADAKPKAIITTAEYYERSGSKFGQIPFFVCGPQWKEELPTERISHVRPAGMTWESLA